MLRNNRSEGKSQRNQKPKPRTHDEKRRQTTEIHGHSTISQLNPVLIYYSMPSCYLRSRSLAKRVRRISPFSNAECRYCTMKGTFYCWRQCPYNVWRQRQIE